MVAKRAGSQSRKQSPPATRAWEQRVPAPQADLPSSRTYIPHCLHRSKDCNPPHSLRLAPSTSPRRSPGIKPTPAKRKESISRFLARESACKAGVVAHEGGEKLIRGIGGRQLSDLSPARAGVSSGRGGERGGRTCRTTGRLRIVPIPGTCRRKESTTGKKSLGLVVSSLTSSSSRRRKGTDPKRFRNPTVSMIIPMNGYLTKTSTIPARKQNAAFVASAPLLPHYALPPGRARTHSL